MSLKKTMLKTKPITRVLFRLEGFPQASKAIVCGDFNKWSQTRQPMKKLRTGVFTLEMEFKKGKTYQFKYLIDDSEWQNDPEADGYIRTQEGFENSLIIL